MSETVHPRPLMTREAWQELDGPWGFAYDDARVGLGERWQERREPFARTIQVPFPPESDLSGIGDPSYHPVVWYRREVALPPRGDGDRLLLHLGAVDHEAMVWCDGRLVGAHVGGHTPFTCDLTDVLDPGATTAVLVVRAVDEPLDVGQPRGKQDWEEQPHGIWYHRTTGIWQPVWLEVVPAAYVARVQWVPEVAAQRVRGEVEVAGSAGRALRVRVVLRHEDEPLGEATQPVTGAVTLLDVPVPALANQLTRARLLWRPGSPTLVDVRVQLLEGDRVVDEVASYTGLRSVGVADGAFTLNGKAVYLRGVLSQGYWPRSHLAAPSPEALRREVELVKRLGFNWVRVHQKVEDPRFLYWCDRLGLLVWGEMANAYAYDERAAALLTREWVEVVRRDRSHPCVVAWVPHNESWGIQDLADDLAQRSFASALYHLTKALDPTRPVVSNDGWEHVESDVWTVHDYAPSGRRLTERYGTAAAVTHLLTRGRVQGRRAVLLDEVDTSRPVVVSEFGGVRFDPVGKPDGWGYSEVRSPAQLVERLDELVAAVVHSPALAGFCWTQLTDTEQEQNGLLTADREPKAPFGKIRGVVRQPAASETGGP